MQIFFNEISIKPVAITEEDARQKIYNLLETMKKLKDYDFNVLRTHNDFFAEDLGNGYTFSSFINDPNVRQDIKLLLRTLVKNPFIIDDDSYEAEMFISREFETMNHLGNRVSPEGLAVAYLNSLPCLSISGHSFWETPLLSLNINDITTQEAISENIINLYSPQITEDSPFIDWLKSISEEIALNSLENIYKVFSPDRYSFDNKAIDDILSWYYNDKRFLVRIKELLENIENNPFVGGKGFTELLSGTSGKASKRITKKDRIVYTYTSEKIIVHQCRGHYNDT